MASTYQIATNYYDTRRLRLYCTQTRNIASNTSTINWTLYSEGGVDGNYSTGPTTVTINGVTVYSKPRVEWNEYSFPASKGSVSGSLVVGHNNNGSKSVTVSLTTAIYVFATSTYSGTWVLDANPRASSYTVTPLPVPLGSDMTFAITPYVSTYKHDIYVGVDGYKSFEKINDELVSTSFTWTLPKSWAEYVPNGERLHTRIWTYNGTTEVGYSDVYVAVQATEEMKPVASVTVTDATDNLEKYGGLVETKSIIKATGSAELYAGTSIANQYVKINDLIYNNTNEVIQDFVLSTNSVTVTYSVQDGRGLTDSVTITPTVLEYTNPSILTFSVNRCNQDGTLNDEGAYALVTFNYSIAPLSNLNSKNAKVEYKKHSDASYTSQSVSLSTYQGTATAIIPTDTEFTWDILLTISDDFSSTSASDDIGTAYTLVDYHTSGRGIAFGKVAESADLFDSNIPALFREGLSVGNDTDANVLEIGNFTSQFVSDWETELGVSPPTLQGILEKLDSRALPIRVLRTTQRDFNGKTAGAHGYELYTFTLPTGATPLFSVPYTEQVSASKGLQITTLFLNSTQLYINYYCPEAITASVPVAMDIFYI